MLRVSSTEANGVFQKLRAHSEVCHRL